LGAQLAAQGGKLRLVHATPSLAFAGIYGGPEGTWMPPGTLKELDEQAQHTSMKIMRDLARRYARDIDVECHAPAGTPTEVILEQADAFDADVIIMATSGRGRARRLFLGSTADKVIRRARCPVLVIPSDVEDAPGWSDDPIPK
jgi:nucleotide-binding universal stress UspA family protein